MTDHDPTSSASPLARLAQVVARSQRFRGDAAALDNGEQAALARLDPDAPRPHQVGALARALVLAGILLSAFNLRTAVTSLTPLLDRLGDDFGFGPTFAGLLGMKREDSPDVDAAVAAIIADVRARGEARDVEALWGLYRQTRRAEGARAVSVFPLWRHERAGGDAARRWSVLKGLLAYDRTATTRQVRFLWLGRVRLAAPAVPAAESPDETP